MITSSNGEVYITNSSNVPLGFEFITVDHVKIRATRGNEVVEKPLTVTIEDPTIEDPTTGGSAKAGNAKVTAQALDLSVITFSVFSGTETSGVVIISGTIFFASTTLIVKSLSVL
jgi:hypothetical protein